MIINHQHCPNKLNQTKSKEPDMKNKKYRLVLTFSLSMLVFFGLSCDDRKASETVNAEGLTLAFIESQPVANGATVGEAIVGYAGVYLIVELRDSDGQPVKNGIISFSARANDQSYGGFDANVLTTDSDGRAFVTYSANEGSGAVDNPSTPKYENVEVTAYYSENLEASTRFDVYGSKDDVWPYTFTMTDPNPEEITLATQTPSNINCRLLNKNGTPVRNVIVQIDAGEKGYIKINDNVVDSDTTDNNGEISFSFHDNGEQDNIGIASVVAVFNHPSINATVSDTSTISIVSEVGLVQECTYVEIPSSVPSNIVVRDGGGIESTSIRAKLYDDNDNLIAEPRLVRFVLNPVIEGTYLEEPGVSDTSVYTVNGIATVSVNSGTAPGTVRIEVGVDCDQDGDYEINANAVPVIIASGAPYHIEPEYDPNSTEPIGGGFYKTQCAAIVYDKWYNPVEDSTYVYWSIDPIMPDTLIDAFVEGISFTGNENLDGDVIGVHDGIINFTIGQRKGIKLSNTKPLYVIKIDAEKNEIIVGSKENLGKKDIYIKDINLLSEKNEFEQNIYVKVRSTGKLLEAKIDFTNKGMAKVNLKLPEEGISPGQACVFYNKDAQGFKVLGGGWIYS